MFPNVLKISMVWVENPGGVRMSQWTDTQTDGGKPLNVVHEMKSAYYLINMCIAVRFLFTHGTVRYA